MVDAAGSDFSSRPDEMARGLRSSVVRQKGKRSEVEVFGSISGLSHSTFNAVRLLKGGFKAAWLSHQGEVRTATWFDRSREAVRG